MSELLRLHIDETAEGNEEEKEILFHTSVYLMIGKYKRLIASEEDCAVQMTVMHVILTFDCRENALFDDK